MGAHVRAGDRAIWTEQLGEGPDVLLIGGLVDTRLDACPHPRTASPEEARDGTAHPVR